MCDCRCWMVKRKRMMVADARLWAMQSEGGVCEAYECKVNLKNYGSHTHSLTEVDTWCASQRTD